MMKVTKRDIIRIKAGTSATFTLPDWESCKSAQSYAYQLSYSREKPCDVLKYKTSLDPKSWTLTIEAVKR